MKKNLFSCYIISETSLGMQCAEYILQKGCKVLGIISSDQNTIEWAHKNKIQIINSLENFYSLNLKPKSFDFLFSMVNYSYMKDSILDFPKHYAINYHDSILPKYAGVHATSWAILNKEEFHGVSWHVMNKVIDSGDIIKQCSFRIDKNDTAFSLNVKCYNYAIKLFKELVDDILYDRTSLIPQNLNERTYFGLHLKPENFGFIKWSMSSEEILRLFRATYFGNYQNMFVSCKFSIGCDIFIPTTIEELLKKSNNLPGTIIDIFDNSLVVSTLTNDIILRDICLFSGELIHIKDIIEKYKISVGSNLEQNNEERITFLKDNAQILSSAEQFWRQKFKSVNPAQINFISYSDQSSNFISLTKKFAGQMDNVYDFFSSVLTAFLFYLDYVGNVSPFDIGYITTFIKNLDKDSQNTYSQYVPLKISLLRNDKFIEVVENINKLVNVAEKKLAYFNDIFVRYLEITDNKGDIPILVNPGNYNDLDLTLCNQVLILSINAKDKNYSISLRSNNLQKVESILEQLDNILNQLYLYPYKTLSSLEILNKNEENKILSEWNNRDRLFDKSANIYSIFSEKVKNFPDRIAVVFQSQQITYKYLGSVVDNLANYLSHKKFPLESRIAVLLNRGIELFISMLAICKAGLVYVPLDPTAPKDRNDYILSDSSPCMLITSKNFLFSTRCEIYLVENMKNLPDEEISTVFPSVDSESISYIIYTSGSTGNPKGVMVHHLGMINHLYCKIDDLELCSSDIIAQTATQIFDISIWQFFCSIILGSRLVILDDNEVMDPSLLLNIISKQRVTILELVPSHSFALLEGVSNFELNWSLKYLLVTGEALFFDLCNGFLKLDPNLRIVNAYGPTECSDDVTHYIVKKQTDDFGIVPIGSVLNNLQCYVLNHNLAPLPVGIIGELYIGGIGLARGYFNRADLTSERFIANPFQKSTRLYKTGDLVRWQENGIIEYIGRNDFQVKIRGHRIELEEIESVLKKYPSVKHAVLVCKKNNKKENVNILIGYFVSEEKLPILGIMEYLKELLPEYMVPNFIIQIDNFPLTPNGKLDRAALPDPIVTETTSKPQNAIEKELCKIFASVLSLSEEIIGLQSDFLKLGGDSITAIRLVNNVRQRFGISITLGDIFENSSIIKLLNNVLKTRLSNQNLSVESIQEQGVLSGYVPLHPIQKWFFSNDFSNLNYWNQSFIIKSPKLDINKLKSSIVKLALYHDALRLRYKIENNKIKQYYISNFDKDFTINTLDIKDLNASEMSIEFTKEINSIFTNWQSNFNIERGPIFCVGYIYGFKDGSCRIFFSAHHLIIDSISWRIILDDLKALYEGKELSHKATSYRQWVKSLEKYSLTFLEEQFFWESIFDEYKKNKPNILLGNRRKDVYQFKFDTEFTKLLIEEAGTKVNASINDILLTTLTYVLRDILGNKINFITLEGHGREEIFEGLNIFRTVGWFTSLFPFKLEVMSNYHETLMTTKDFFKNIPNKGMGYGFLIGYEKRELPKIIFNYYGQFEHRSNNNWEIIDEPKGNWCDEENYGKNYLAFNCLIINGHYMLSVESNYEFFDSKKIADLHKLYLEEIITSCKKEKRTYLTLSDVDNVISKSELQNIQAIQEVNSIYLVNSLQEGFLYHYLRQGHIDDAYTVQSIWKYNQFIDVEKLKEAWVNAQENFSCLRMRFSWSDVLVQIIDKNATLDFNYIDITNSKDKNKIINEIQQSDRLKKYDLSISALFRIYIVKHSENLYTCLFSNHHSILDGWSLFILFDYVHKFYLKSLAMSTLEYEIQDIYPEIQSFFQRNQNKDLITWNKYLSEIDEDMHLSFLQENQVMDLNDYSHVKSEREEHLIISDELLRQLTQLAHENGFTLTTIFIFVWHKCLSVFLNAETTVSGTVFSGRTLPVNDIEKAVGLLINTLPVAVKHSYTYDMTVTEVLLKIQREINDLSMCSTVRLSSLKKNDHRLFNNLFVYENYPKPDTNNYANKLKVNCENIIEKVDYPLGVVVIENKESIIFKIKYAGEIFGSSIIVSMKSFIYHLLSEISSNSEQKIGNLSYFGSTKEIQNFKNKDYNIVTSTKTTIVSVFENIVIKFPDRAALAFGSNIITYKELNEKANLLAHYISSKKKIKGEQNIVILLSKKDDIVISIISILKLGFCYVPLDPSFPDSKINSVISYVNPIFIITSDEFKDRLNHFHEKLIICNSQENQDFWCIETRDNINYSIDEFKLAYIIFTSGTTGQPKGVMIEQKSVINLVYSQSKEFNLNDSKQLKNCLWYSNVVFDAHVSEVFTAILNGHTLHYLNEEEKHNNLFLKKYIEDNRIDIATIPPVVIRSFDLFPLKTIVSAGDKVDKKTLSMYVENNVHIINAYGPTEASVCSTLKHYKSGSQNNIGRAISNIECYILDTALNPVPLGAVGELYVSGAGLARGYYNNQSLTAQKFIANPFSNLGERMYSTGDLAKCLENGDIEFICRIDSQIKIRGNRVELGEIEAILKTLSSIKEAVIVLKEINNISKLVGYYTCDSVLDPKDVLNYLKETVPSYMVPSALLQIKEIPVSINGKVLKTDLPDIDGINDNFVEPTNAIEKEVCNILENILGLQPKSVGIEDDFFHLGGDSLSAIKLITKISEKWKINLNLSEIFKKRIVKDLVVLLESYLQTNLEGELYDF